MGRIAGQSFMVGWIFSISLLVVGCGRSPDIILPPSAATLTIASPAFATDREIPIEYTCDGANISPALTWDNVPESAQSLVFWMEDPDAPRGTFTHWLVYDMPATRRDLPKDISPSDVLPQGGTQGKNSFRNLGYGGPCPPKGTHRYAFKLYALNQPTELPPNASIVEVAQRMNGNIVGFGEFTVPYTRQSP
ncbi:MAG: YbhB/YbcL family Raf kinase inhibitor-like protein [Cyanobacteria bacterium P01_F01_bin.150]